MQVKKLENKKIDIVYANYYFLNQITGFKKKAYKKKLPEGIIYHKLLKDYCIGIGTVVMRKSLFLKNKEIFNKKFNIIGDFDLFIRLSKNIYFASIQEPLSIYRIHNKSFSNKHRQMYINELKFWLIKQKIHDSSSFIYVRQRLIYLEAIFNILNKKYILSLKKIFQVFSLEKKIKLFFFLLIPSFILKKLKDNFS